VNQPRWSPDGALHWISDRTGWWNLYREGEPLQPLEAEFAGPDWAFGQSTYAFLPDGRLVAAWTEGGRARLGLLSPGSTTPEPLETPYTAVASMQPFAQGVVAISASTTEEPAIVVIDIAGGSGQVVRRSRSTHVDGRLLSEPRHIEFPTEGGRTAHAFHYPPANAGYAGPEGERPPLLVRSHGGPTGAASPALRLDVQFWTSRGIAVVDVDYGGSTGYGRDYRKRLEGQWGVVDAQDCVNAARYLVALGHADGRRLMIRGSSAGGYTTLCALTFHDVFAAGASYYGVADAEALARDTHKFESRYLDGLIGPYPERADLYRRRSPVHFPERLTAPIIVFQGLDDRVVPPAQAEAMVAARREKGLPFAYLTFAGEQHGLRKAENIRRAAEAELWFFATVLGFEPADDIEPVPIENLALP
jgi:dipeptidyl aminopeptidase/acylaminoacyl peptidase